MRCMIPNVFKLLLMSQGCETDTLDSHGHVCKMSRHHEVSTNSSNNNENTAVSKAFLWPTPSADLSDRQDGDEVSTDSLWLNHTAVTHTLGSINACARVPRHPVWRTYLLSWCFKPSQPQRIISWLKKTFIKRYIVERTNKADKDRKNGVRKQTVAGRIYGMKYS